MLFPLPGDEPPVPATIHPSNGPQTPSPWSPPRPGPPSTQRLILVLNGKTRRNVLMMGGGERKKTKKHHNDLMRRQTAARVASDPQRTTRPRRPVTCSPTSMATLVIASGTRKRMSGKYGVRDGKSIMVTPPGCQDVGHLPRSWWV